MTPQQTKFAITAAVIVAILGGSYALNRSVNQEKTGAAGDSSERAGVDVTQSRIGTRGGRGGSGASDGASVKGKSGKGARGGSSAGDDAALASVVDSATTEVLPIETEAETRERERYEKAQANKFKYRELDPEKIKPAELTPALENVSKEYQIPDNLLAAMMYVETGGTHRDGDHSMEAGYGVMNLRENNMVDTLAEASSLIGKSKEEVLYDQATNIKAAGALLKSYHDDALASGLSESEAWYAAVSQYSGRPDPELAANLADEAAGWMLRGFELHLNDGGGDVVVPPSSSPPFLPKNWELVGMTPPGQNTGPELIPGSTPPNAQSFNDTGSAAGGAQVAP